MTKYTRHKHGMTIGSGDWFLLYDGEGDKQADYRAMVSAGNFNFKQINPYNCLVMTPAQQIIWERKDGHEFTLNPYTHRWLLDNVGERGPQWYIRKHPIGADDAVLFRLRGKALAFIKMISENLEGKGFRND